MSSNYGGTATELVPGTLRGYRAWYMGNPLYLGNGDVPLLRSVAVNFSWPPGETPHAGCTHTGLLSTLCQAQHLAPVDDCSCGYYAAYQLTDLPLFKCQNDFGTDDAYVFGSVTAYGRVMLGTKGFRAEYMKIESFAGNGDFSWLADLYGVEHARDFEELLDKFPPPNVDELIGVPHGA